MNGKQLKNSILQWAIQGKLVPQDPNDEPASALLERIRAEKAKLVKEKKIKKDKNESIIYRGEDNSYYEKVIATGEVKCIDDEIPFEIPQSWSWERFGSLANHSPQVSCEDDTEVAFMPMANISAGYGSVYTFERKLWKEVKTGYTKIQRGDIAYAKITPCFQNRKSFILEEVPGNVAAATTELNVIRTYTCDDIYTFYILYILKSDYFIKEARYKGTAGQQRVLADYVKTKLIPIPPTNEQVRICSVLKQVMPVVDKYNKSQEELNLLNKCLNERIKKSILQEAIQGRLVPQLTEEGTAAELLEQIKAEKKRLVAEGKLKKSALVDSVIYKGDDNKYYEQIGQETSDITENVPFDLPSQWNWVRLSNIVQLSIGKTPARGETKFWANAFHNWVSISDMADYGHVSRTKEGLSKEAETIMGELSPVGTLLMSFKLTVGRTSILDIPAYHNEAIVSVYPYKNNDTILINYLFYILPVITNFGDSKDAIKGRTLNSKSMNALLCPLPPFAEQKRIVEKIEEILHKL